jgi:WD40 repeat protein
MASGGGDSTVRLWDVDKGTQTMCMRVAGAVTSVAFSLTGRVAASSYENQIYIWGYETGKLVAQIQAPHSHKDIVSSIIFSPSGKHLLTGSFDRTIKVWLPEYTPNGLVSSRACETYKVSLRLALLR